MTQSLGRFHLEGLTGEFEGRNIDLVEDVIWLGRAQPGTPSASTHLLFDDSSVSRVHGALQWAADYDTYVLHHRSQTNPTFLNNQPVTKPCLLKPGDVLTFGRQSFRYNLKVPVETVVPSGELPAPVPVTEEQPAPPPIKRISLGGSTEQPTEDTTTSRPGPPAKVIAISTDVPELKVGFRHQGNTFTARSEKTVCLKFSPQFTQVRGPVNSDSNDELKVYEVPAPHSSELHFHLYVDGSRAVEAKQGEHSTSRRISPQDNVFLELPIKATTRIPLKETDIVTHQECHCWIVEDSDEAGDQQGRLPDLTEPFGYFEFKSGNWRGARIVVLSEEGTDFRLGPQAELCHYELPVTGSPTCRVTTQDGKAQVEVVDALEVNYLSINGELLFLGKSAPLRSGSDLFMGNLLLVWIQPAVQEELKKYKLRCDQNVISLNKEVVRIGTAAHCEVIIEDHGLPTVAGSLHYSPEGFTYHHNDSTTPAEVDGQTVDSLGKAPLQQTLKLNEQCTLTLTKE